MGVTTVFKLNNKSTTTTTTTMMKLTIALLACMLVAAAAQPKYQRLQKLEPKLGCSIAEMLECASEIGTITNDCGHLATAAEIQACIDDVLGATDCMTCICDIIGC